VCRLPLTVAWPTARDLHAPRTTLTLTFDCP